MTAPRILLSALALAAAPFMPGCAALPVDVMPTPLTDVPGDALRGRAVAVSREGGNCVLCHAVPGESTAGDIGPPLAGVGARLSVAALRLRVVDITRVNPEAAMPAFHRTDGLDAVAARHVGQPLLSAQQVEDVVAFLGTLR